VPGLVSENIAAMSKKALRWYLFYMIFITWWFLAIIGTSDRRIVVERTVRLPVFGIDIPLDFFFAAAPVFALLAFINLQFYLGISKESIVDMRANHGPAKRTGLSPLMASLCGECGTGVLEKGRRMFARILLWSSLPFLSIHNAFWYLRTHNSVQSYGLGAMTLLGSLVVLWFWLRSKRSGRRKSWLSKLFYTGFVCLIAAVEISFFLLFIPSAQRGGLPNRWKNTFLSKYLHRVLFVDLSYQRLVLEPVPGRKDVYLGDLSRARLQGADLRGCVLARADLRGADFKRAMMKHVVIEEADLRFADIALANLVSADAQGADFFRAILRAASLHGSVLRGASIRGADISFAGLSYADLRNADLSFANMHQTSLYQSNLQGADLQGADMSASLLIQADLSNANLKDCNLRRAKFWKTTLQGADLEGALLLEAVDLDLEQLHNVKSLFGAQLDPELLEQVQKNYPHLLEEKKETE